MFAVFESLCRLVMWGVTLWLDQLDLTHHVAGLLNIQHIEGTESRIPCCRSDSNPISMLNILPQYSSSSMSDSIQTEEEVASWGKKVITLQLSDADDVRSETKESVKSPAASWGPTTMIKMPTPTSKATIYCEVGSHNNVYGAGFITLSKLLALLCVKVNVAPLPSGIVWGDVLGFAISKVETPSGKVCYDLHPVEHYWVDGCPHGLSTAHDIHKAFKEANDLW